MSLPDIPYPSASGPGLITTCSETVEKDITLRSGPWPINGSESSFAVGKPVFSMTMPNTWSRSGENKPRVWRSCRRRREGVKKLRHIFTLSLDRQPQTSTDFREGRIFIGDTKTRSAYVTGVAGTDS